MNWKDRKFVEDLIKLPNNENVTLYGWVDTIRDHGQLLFMHLRDRTGVIQIVFDPEKNHEVYKVAQSIRSEYVIEIHGTKNERTEENKNTNLPTGSFEVIVNSLKILTTAKTPPFTITEKETEEENEFNVDEDLRMKFRYLDLRRPSMQQNIIKRSEIIKIIRDTLETHGFIDVETPMLTKSTPEGARDYLVPSRTHAGKFFALPQSPQLFKQLLMLSGLERYFQIVKCFRDEDLRPNRQPEFTQMDLEVSFIDESYIFALMEELMEKVFFHVGKKLSGPFPHITYQEAIEKYGTDRPDLRFGMEMIDVSETLSGINYKIFKTILEKNGKIKGINVKNSADKLSKNMMQEEIAKKVIPSMGAKGLTWMKVVNGKLESNVVQFFTEEEQEKLMKKMGAEDGDILCFIADTNIKLVDDVLGRFRVYMGHKMNLIDTNQLSPCWVTNFPLYEESDGRLVSIHHPFTSPDRDILNIKEKNELLKVNSRGYDLVINGEEIGGGSIRIHDPKVQEKVFQDLGLNDSEIEEKFGFFANAFQYGAPPHGGIALGIDRLVGMILAKENIREVIAFPKNRVAHCPLTQAPSNVGNNQLDDLNIKLNLPEGLEESG